jgi:hypothetical protein
MKKIVVFIFILFNVHLNAQENVNPCEKVRESLLSETENNGYKRGREEGEKEGKAKGIKEGRIEGIEIGRKFNINLFLDSLRANSQRENEFMCLQLQRNPQWKDNVKRNDKLYKMARNTGYYEGFWNNSDEYFRRGFDRGFDSIYTINIRLGQEVTLEPYSFIPKINYDKISKLLANVNGSNYSSEFTFFNYAVQEIHTEILAYLVKRLGLNSLEQQEVYEEYGKIHEKLVKLYYKKYLQIMKTKSLPYDKNYYDYGHYHSVNVFLEIISSGICSLSDVLFTYAKSNTQFAAINGLEVMGSICELIIDEILLSVDDGLVKTALIYSYDKNIENIDSYCKNTLEPMIIESLIDIKEVKGTIEISKDYSAEVTMEIETVYNIGLNLEDFSVNVDHQDAKFTINLSNKPRIINIVYQTYKIKKIKNKIGYTQSVYKYGPLNREEKPVKKEKKETKYCTISGDVFDDMFNRDKPSVEDLDLETIEREKINHIAVILMKALEPAIALPSACYSVILNFGEKEESLLTIDCN